MIRWILRIFTLEPRKPESAVCPRVWRLQYSSTARPFWARRLKASLHKASRTGELLLVDDGSGPAAATIAKTYAARFPERIRYLEHPGHNNRGMSATRNLGTQHARGEFIAFIDADDFWLPSKLADHVALLDAYPTSAWFVDQLFTGRAGRTGGCNCAYRSSAGRGDSPSGCDAGMVSVGNCGLALPVRYRASSRTCETAGGDSGALHRQLSTV